jgi:hypothetical protein
VSFGGAAKGWSLSINSGQTVPSGLTGSAAFDPRRTFVIFRMIDLVRRVGLCLLGVVAAIRHVRERIFGNKRDVFDDRTSSIG